MRAQSAQHDTAYQIFKGKQLDSLRSNFQLKKRIISQLSDGQSPATLLTYYEFYLQEKDWKKADSMFNTLLKITDAVNYRYQISLISNRNMRDTKTPLLFLSNKDKITEYRSYFLNVKVSSLTSNEDKRVHYYNLVALDSTDHLRNPDSLKQVKMGQHYNSLAWYSILNHQLVHVAYYLDQSMKYDPKSKYPVANRPLLFLLQGRYKEAKTLYLKYKDEPFDGTEFKFKDEFLVDFKELAAAGITNRHIIRITNLLNSK